MLPIYTRYLSKSDYGVLEILLPTSNIILLVLQLGLASALFRSILYRQKTDRKTCISTAYFFLLIFSAIVLTILFVFAGNFSQLLFNTLDKKNLLQLVFIGDFFLILNAIPMAVLRVDQRSITFAFIAGSNFFVTLCLNLLFVVHLKQGIYGTLLANTLGALFFSLIYFWVIRKNIVLKFSASELKSMLAFGLPLVPGTIGDMFMLVSDRYFLKFYRGLEQVATYSLAIRIATMIALLVAAFQLAWPAIFFPLAKEENAQEIFAKLFNYFIFFFIYAWLFVAIFSSDIIGIFATASYMQASYLVPIISMANIFIGMYYFTSIGIQLKKKTGMFPLFIGIACLFNIITSFIIIPEYGMFGAAFVKVFSYGILALGICLISLRYYYIKFDIKKIAKLFIIAFSLYFIQIIISLNFSQYLLLFKIILIIAFPVIIISTDPIRKELKKFILKRI